MLSYKLERTPLIYLQNALLNQLQTTIRAINTDVALLLSHDAEITRSTDVDLLLSSTAFNHLQHLRLRYLTCPLW